MAWIRNALAGLWTSLGNIVMIIGWIGSSTLLALAAKAAGIMSASAPFSWVAIGFAGAFVLAVSYALIGWGKNAAILARARQRVMVAGDAINPMDDIFVSKRIYIADFVNPFNQVVMGKKFIRCEIIGPVNIMPLLGGGKFVGNNFDQSDAVELTPGVIPNNAIAFANCDFEECRFFKVTLIFHTTFRQEADKLIAKLNWLIRYEDGAVALAESKVDEPTRFERILRRFNSSDTSS